MSVELLATLNTEIRYQNRQRGYLTEGSEKSWTRAILMKWENKQ